MFWAYRVDGLASNGGVGTRDSYIASSLTTKYACADSGVELCCMTG